MMKRLFDIVFAISGLIIFSPLFVVVGLVIVLQDGWPIFFRQQRVGRKGRMFNIIKFRSMKNRAGAALTMSSDERITSLGRFIRKYKIDELPQLINVLQGHMSFVGPRPELPQYVNKYTMEQALVLNYKPGITDPASIAYRRESDLLEQADNWEEFYLNEIMPKKIAINLDYCGRATLLTDTKIILQTLWLSFSGR